MCCAVLCFLEVLFSSEGLLTFNDYHWNVFSLSFRYNKQIECIVFIDKHLQN